MNATRNTAGGQRPATSHPKSGLLAKWLQVWPRANENGLSSPIRRRTDAGAAELSFEQQRFWFFHQLEPKSTLYTMPIGARLKGKLEPQALQQALDTVVARHEVLRTRLIGEGPLLVTDAPRPVTLTQIDLRNVPSPQREGEARRLLTAEALRAFDLAQDLMMRVTLVRLENDQWIFLLLQHHIASDDWSWRVLCDEVAEVYAAFIAGRKADLPEMSIQYRDFAAWQRMRLCGATLENLQSYWRKKLSGAPHVLELPTDYPRPSTQRFRGACQWSELPRALIERISALSQKAGATPFMILFAVFQTLLHRYSGQEDFLVGSPVAGRTNASVEKLIGVFVNTVVLRADVAGDPTFNDLLQRVQTTVLEAIANEALPFDKLVQELELERSPSHSPLIQVMFALQNELSENLRLPGITVSPYHVEMDTAKFDLTLTIVQSTQNANWKFCVEYNTDLFKPSTVERMQRHFERLLESALLNPEKKLSELPLLSEQERREVLIQWNQTKADYPDDECVHELFAKQAAERPEAVAASCSGAQLTYGELNRRANQLAHHLRRFGVGPERLVAVAMDRSLDMVVALLGIFKAGGAYLPLDPGYPVERLQFMLQDSGASLLLSQFPLAPVGLFQSVHTICLDTDWSKIAEEPDAEPESTASADNLAYVIYTSGSTGQPKGAQITHRSVVNLLHSMRREPGLSRDDTLLSVTSISFDIAALEIFLPLTTGARMVVADTSTILDPDHLARLAADCHATVMQATPTLWRALIDSGWRGSSRLKIITGGEPLTPDLAVELLDRCAEVWNFYGPTETTIYSTGCKVDRGERPISIGRPIANTQIYLLDRYLQPVPRGFPGMLHIGGAGLARGYLNRPKLTSERFVPNPFDKQESERLYNSGDIARHLPNGKIECLGRADSQVKLRGFRIDLAEVESTLRQHRAVRDAVVILRQDAPNQKRLVAYVIATNGVAPVEEMRLLLLTKLPDYMIPEAFITLNEFPTTPNGKIDRNALLPPEPLANAVDVNSAFPRTDVERQLASIWCDVMKRDQIGRDENFFDIGGHSLAAMMVLSRVRKVFDVDITIRDIFERPTIAGLAAIIAKQAGLSTNEETSPVEALQRT